MSAQTEREALVQAIASSLAMSYGSHVNAPKGGRDWKAAEDLLGVLEHLGLHRPTPRTVTTVEWGIEYDIDVDNTVTEFGMSERDAKEAERLSPTDTRAVFRHLADQTEREALGRVIADYQACGHCDGTCGACLGEADAILAALPSLGYRLIDPDDEALVATAAAAFQEAWDSGIQDFDPDHDDYDTYIQRCMRAALKAVQT